MCKCQAGCPIANLDWLYPSLNSATPTKILRQPRSSPGSSTQGIQDNEKRCNGGSAYPVSVPSGYPSPTLGAHPSGSPESGTAILLH